MKDRKALKGSEVSVGWCKNRPTAYTFSLIYAYSTSSLFVFRPFNN